MQFCGFTTQEAAPVTIGERRLRIEELEAELRLITQLIRENRWELYDYN